MPPLCSGVPVATSGMEPVDEEPLSAASPCGKFD